MDFRHYRLFTLLPLFLGLLLLAIGTSTAASFPAPSVERARVIYLAASGYDRANTLAFSPNGRILAVGSSLGIYLYDSRTLGEIRFIPAETWVRSLAFSPDGGVLATGSYDQTVRLWRVVDGTLLRALKGHTSWVRSVVFSPNGETLASASDDNTVRLWRVSDGVPLRTLEEGTEGVRAVAFSPDGEMLATGGYDNAVRLWRFSEGAPLHTLQGHTGWVRTITFSSDGDKLASGGFDATARLWRVADGALLHTLEGHTASVLSVAFSPDGEVLATGSVDTTSRLWRVSDGASLRVLAGHEDFIFSVSFAPGGKELATGAVDNTVRLWQVEGIESATPLEEEVAPAEGAGQNCVTCHHPRGNYLQPNSFGQPPRVLENGCTTCHLGGALVLNWCPAFPRSPGPLSLSVAPPVAPDKVGVPRGNRDIGVVIATPINGEHFYSPWIVTAIPVGGRVYYAGDRLTDIEVRLEIWSGLEQVAISTTQPQRNGYFSFDTNLSPDGIELEVPIDQRGCIECHSDNLRDKPYLPAGDVRLVVTALTPDGKQASDERWIVVDRSQQAEAIVQTTIEDSGQPISGLPVQASTRLYEWRARHANALTDRDGVAQLELETLTRAATSYRIEVPATVVDGILYESVEPVEIILPPAATSAPPISLSVRARLGQIVGRLSTQAGTAIPSLPVWAVHLPDGSSYRTHASAAGDFTFSDIPIGQYVITVNSGESAEYGFISSDHEIDLRQSPVAAVEMSLDALEGYAVRGVIRDASGSPIPFAWATIEKVPLTRRVAPDTGAYALVGLPPEPATLIVSAPGFYSQAHLVTPLQEPSAPFVAILARRPETRSLPWGSGEVIIPPESQASIKAGQVTLTHGWLWGHGSGDSMVIKTPQAEISIREGTFALEQRAGQPGWFYLMAGEAAFRTQADGEQINVHAGEMVALTGDLSLKPVPLDPVVIAAIRPSTDRPASPVWQPSLEAQIRDGLAQIGIGTAQVITFVTYLLIVSLLVLLPAGAVVWWLRHRGRGPDAT